MSSPTWTVAGRAWIVLVCRPLMRWQYVPAALVLGTSLGTSPLWAQPETAPTTTPAAPAEPAGSAATGTTPAPAPTPAAPPSPAPAPTATTAPAAAPTPPASADADASARRFLPPDTRIQPETPGARPLVVDQTKNPGFRFGSYGRALAGTDFQGGKARKLLIASRGSRVVEDSYLALDFSYGFNTNRGPLRPVITLAFAGLLFHDTGQFDAQPALRNMFLEGQVAPNLHAWAGSRMYRGDDVYMFDFWPLDDQNTLGTGLIYNGAPLELAAHVGFNRLNNPFQYQTRDVPNPVQGATTVEQLNRQRIIASTTMSYIARDVAPDVNAKIKLHAEVHTLPAGTREREDDTFERLPSDSGFLVGGQIGFWGFAPKDSPFRRHVNLFARYAKGLAAFDELAQPTSFGPQLKTTRANEIQLALSAAWDHELGNIMLGALSRRFIDADTSPTDADDGWEYSVGARPLARIVPDFFIGADINYQARFPKGLNPITLRAEDPALFQIAPMLVYSPMGPSAYDRPQLRLVYRAAHLNDAARNLYVPDDPRFNDTWVHYIGAQAEWWFNSNTYR